MKFIEVTNPATEEVLDTIPRGKAEYYALDQRSANGQLRGSLWRDEIFRRVNSVSKVSTSSTRPSTSTGVSIWRINPTGIRMGENNLALSGTSRKASVVETSYLMFGKYTYEEQ